MCTCKEENSQKCSCHKKWLWLTLGILVLGGLTWWYFIKKKQAG